MHLPIVLAGPIVRRVAENSSYLWLATSKPVKIDATVFVSENANKTVCKKDLVAIGCSAALGSGSVTQRIGNNLHVTLVRLNPSEKKFPVDKILYYDLTIRDENENVYDFGDLAYEGAPLPSFYIPAKLKVVLHGS